MDSAADLPCGRGCPIRRSSDQSLLAAPQGLSQRATSFIASWRQGIHQMPLLSSTPTSDNRSRTGRMRRPSAGDGSSDYLQSWASRQRSGGQPAYPCQRRPCPQTEETNQEGQRRRLADAHRPARQVRTWRAAAAGIPVERGCSARARAVRDPCGRRRAFASERSTWSEAFQDVWQPC